MADRDRHDDVEPDASTGAHADGPDAHGSAGDGSDADGSAGHGSDTDGSAGHGSDAHGSNADGSAGHGPDADGIEPPRDRADEFERRVSVPVLVAALVSIPAVFLTRTGGVTAAVGIALNWASVAVLITESVALLWLSGSVRTWLRRYRWQLLVAAAAVPAVVFVVGPLQVLRLVLLVGGFHILRARRIVRAGQVVVTRLGLGARRARWVFAGVFAAAGVFAVIVLADPESRSRRVADWFVARIGLVPTVLVGLVATGVVYAVARLLTRIRR